MCILGVGSTKSSVRVLASRLADHMRQGTLAEVAPHEVGLGPAQAARLSAVREIVYRYQQRSSVQIGSVRDVALLCQDFANSTRERLRIFYCSTDGRVVHQEDIALGGMNMVTVSPREIFFPIRWHPVDSLVLCHNHPSGNVAASAPDKVFTTRVNAAAQLLGIWVRDHVIISGEKTYSFREEGLLS